MGSRPAGGGALAARPMVASAAAAVALAAGLALAAAPAVAAELAVRGRVLDPEGRPVHGAAVELVALESHYDATLRVWRGEAEPAGAARTATGERGDFLLRAPEPGFWKTVVRAEGFVAAEHPHVPLTEDEQLVDLLLVRDEGVIVEIEPAAAAPDEGATGAASAGRGDAGTQPAGGSDAEAPAAHGTVAEQPPAYPVRVEISTLGERPLYAAGRWRAVRRSAILTSAPGSVRLARGEGELVEIQAFGEHAAAARVEARGSRTRLALARASRRLALRVREEGGAPIAGALVCEAASGQPRALTDAEGRAEIAVAAPIAPGPSERFELVLLSPDHRAGSFELDGGAEAVPAGAEAALTLRRAEGLLGTVVDDGSDAPIAGAWIWMDLRRESDRGPGLSSPLLGDLGALVRSDARGRFAAQLAPGARPRAAAAGYLSGVVIEGDGSRNRASIEPPPLDGTVVRLHRAAWIAGRVVDAADQPVAGALVALAGPPPSSNPERAFADEAGRFRLGGLAAPRSGAIRLVVLAEGFAPAVEEVELGGAPGRQGLVLRLERGRVARGRVDDLDGNPVAGARLRFVEAGGANRWPRPPWFFRSVPALVTTTAAGGAFVLRGVPAGLYDVTVDAEGYAVTAVPGLAIATGDGDADLGTFLVGRGVTVEGVVVDGDDAPLAGATIQVRRQPRFDRVAEPAGAEPWGSWLRRRDQGATTVESDALGRFVLADLNPSEKVDLFASLDGHVSAWVPGVAGPTEEPVRIVLEVGSAVLGRVVDEGGEAIAGSNLSAQAVASPDRQSARVDGEGRFELRSLAPGGWRVQASASGYEPAEATVELEAGEVEDGVLLVLREQETGRIEGRVVDDEGTPVTGARVNVLSAGTTGARTGGGGEFTIERVPLGRQRIRAVSGQRVATEGLDVREGTNTVELTLEGGVEISGRVIDREGNAVAGASVSLSGSRPPELQAFRDGLTMVMNGGGNRNVRSGDGGAFLLAEVGDGSYALEAVLDGRGRGSLPGELRVAGVPVSGLELVLEPGGSIQGALEGLDFDQLSQVALYGARVAGGAADGRGRTAIGRVVGASEYRIDNLEPGEWHVRGDVREHGLHAEGRVVVERGAETRLDLDFERGLTLSGLVTRRGAPAVGSTLSLRGVDVAVTRGVTVDFEGRYAIRGLEEGVYDVQVMAGRSGGSRVPWTQRIELYGDTELPIDLRTGRLTGVVVDASSGDPLAGATVKMRAASEEAQRPFFADARRSGAAGEFVFDDLPEGTFVLEAAQPGYATADLGVHVREGDEIDGLALELEPIAGLTLRVAGAFAPITWIQVMVFDRRGRPVAGPLRLTAGADGLFEVTGVAKGSWELMVGTSALAWTRVAVEVPGPPVDVALPLAGRLQVEIPELLGSSAVAQLEIVDDAGRAFPSISFGGYEPVWRLESGRRYLDGLPPGRWTLRAVTHDGAVWSGAAATAPGALSQVRLE